MSLLPREYGSIEKMAAWMIQPSCYVARTGSRNRRGGRSLGARASYPSHTLRSQSLSRLLVGSTAGIFNAEEL